MQQVLNNTCVFHCLLGGSSSAGKSSERKVLCVCYGATVDADVSQKSSATHPITVAY